MSNNNNQDNPKNQNENQENQKKMVEVEKKSAVPAISFGISFALLSLIVRLNNPTKLILVVVLSFIVYQIVKSKFPPSKVEIHMQEEPAAEAAVDETKKADSIKNPELKNMNEKIDVYCIEIKILNDFIEDAFISGEVREIEDLLRKIQVQINDESKPNLSKKIDQLNEFIDYYMPTTIKILNSYKKIESQNLTGENAAATKKRVEETLPFIKKAFAKELDNMFSDEMLDITTDIDVLEAMLSKDGLINKDGNNLRNFDI